MGYQDFLQSKIDYGADNGFDPLWMPDFLFDFQVSLTEWAIRKGRAAIFADCGMGKTPMQLVWAQNVIKYTNRPVLILTPLAVSSQTLREAAKFGIPAMRAAQGKKETTIQVTNYEKLHHFDALSYAGVVCDESSILKNFNGTRKGEITEFMRQIPYRLICTATAAPNDYEELGTSSEALGYLGYMDMLGRFFARKQGYGVDKHRKRDKYNLLPHAAKGPFWQWIASWARAARSPSDLGFDDDGFILPLLIENNVEVKTNKPLDGMLMELPATNWREERQAIRNTIQERCEKAAECVEQNGGISMVWCNLNDEGDLLEQLIPGSIQVSGSDSEEKKEEAADWFVNGQEKSRVLISKPTIFGFGLNFQHCQHSTFFPTHSYEQYYQATRRLWRFGQSGVVTIDRIYTNGGLYILQNLDRKAKAAGRMYERLVDHMNDALHIKDEYNRKEIEVPQWMR